jgi:hypothetical protein
MIGVILSLTLFIYALYREIFLFFYFIHTAGKPTAYGIIKEIPTTAPNQRNTKEKYHPPHGRVPTTNPIPPGRLSKEN